MGTAACATRYAGYDRIMGSISWLLIALVSLDIKLRPNEDANVLPLVVFCILLLIYNGIARYGLAARRHCQLKTFVDLMVFLVFTVGVSWFTGRIASPFVSLLYLVLMATALTQGKRATYLMAGLAASSYLLLVSEGLADILTRHGLLGHLLEFFPFMLIGHLGAMLAGEAENARKEVEQLSLTDEITGINNMRNFLNLSGIQEKLARRHGHKFTICMFDADNLKKINDHYGHLAGTELIRHISRIISGNIRSSDIPARYGGDEFIVMFNETSKHDVFGAVLRIVEAVRKTPFMFEGLRLDTTLSAGIASFPEDGEDVRSVMAKADEAMYSSKHAGKDKVTVYGGQSGQSSGRDLALDRDVPDIQDKTMNG